MNMPKRPRPPKPDTSVDSDDSVDMGVLRTVIKDTGFVDKVETENAWRQALGTASEDAPVVDLAASEDPFPGAEMWHTGGGCSALRVAAKDDGVHTLITLVNEGSMAPETPEDACFMGVYDDDGQCLPDDPEVLHFYGTAKECIAVAQKLLDTTVNPLLDTGVVPEWSEFRANLRSEMRRLGFEPFREDAETTHDNTPKEQ